MKWHLLNWTLGPAILAGLLAGAGAGPPAGAAEAWRDLPGTVLGLAGFFGGWYLIMLVLRMLAQRLNEGRLAWSEVRLAATVMAIQWALLTMAMAVLLAIRQGAIDVTGGWSAGWQTMPIGALIGAAVGLPLGIGVARLQIPQRLGLDTIAEKQTNDRLEKMP